METEIIDSHPSFFEQSIRFMNSTFMIKEMTEALHYKEVIHDEKIPEKRHNILHFLYASVFENFDPNHDDILDIEQIRNNIIKRSYNGNMFILLAWRSTFLYYVLSDIQLWTSLIIYVIFRFVINIGTFPINAVAVIGGLMSFILAFFLNSSIGRYLAIYSQCMACQGRIFDATLLSRALFSEEVAVLVVRYMNAVHVLGYMGFSPLYTKENFLIPLNKKYQFLTDSEIEELEVFGFNSGGSAYREILSWILDILEIQVANKVISEGRHYNFLDQVLKLRSSMGSLYDYKTLPVPFIYVHYVYFMSFMYLPLFSILVATNFAYDPRSEFVGYICVFLNCSFILGIRDICARLQDPFGFHNEHFNVVHFVTVSLAGSYKLLNNKVKRKTEFLNLSALQKPLPPQESKSGKDAEIPS